MRSVSRVVVIDASVALKWQLRDESGSQDADRLFDDRSAGLIRLVAPDLWLAEVVNGIKSGVVRQRLNREQGRVATELLRDARVTLYPFQPLVRRTYDLACDLGIAVYDSAYLALAEQLGAELFTADRPLYDRTRTQFPLIRWFTDYRSPQVAG